MPDALAAPMRQFQIHQYRDGRFEVRLVTAGPLAADFHEHLAAEWGNSDKPVPPLAVVLVDEIPRPPGGKFQDFTSDFEPEPNFKGR
jgi:hypothetical protein